MILNLKVSYLGKYLGMAVAARVAVVCQGPAVEDGISGLLEPQLGSGFTFNFSGLNKWSFQKLSREEILSELKSRSSAS